MSNTQTIYKTGWFASATKPVRIGFYETHWLIGSLSRLRFWDGEAWREDDQVCSRQDYTWRGLARVGQNPGADYVAEPSAKRGPIPPEVVNAMANGATPSRACREHLGLKQIEVAARLGISQPAYAQQERRGRLHASSREKIAAALGITADQLDL